MFWITQNAQAAKFYMTAWRAWGACLVLASSFTALPAASSDFSLVVIPDTQNYASTFPLIFDAQTQWIVDERLARNIVYVAHLGDCVEGGDNGGDDSEWQVVEGAISLIEDPVTTGLAEGIPYGLAVGNHDQTPFGSAAGTTIFFNQFFGVSRFLGRSYYGGHYGSNNDNHVDFFSASGNDFIVIYMEYDNAPDAAVLAWADALLAANPNRRGIVVSHFLITQDADWSPQGEDTYEALKGNPNLFLMLAGHRTAEAMRTDVFAGNTVHTLLSNYQNLISGGNGWLRIMEFSPANDEIRIKTYSPWIEAFETDSNSQFVISYDLDEPNAVPTFTPLGWWALLAALASIGGWLRLRTATALRRTRAMTAGVARPSGVSESSSS
jgi:hypothetical protein